MKDAITSSQSNLSASNVEQQSVQSINEHSQALRYVLESGRSSQESTVPNPIRISMTSSSENETLDPQTQSSSVTVKRQTKRKHLSIQSSLNKVERRKRTRRKYN